jgi:hypothetical protein
MDAEFASNEEHEARFPMRHHDFGAPEHFAAIRLNARRNREPRRGRAGSASSNSATAPAQMGSYWKANPINWR